LLEGPEAEYVRQARSAAAVTTEPAGEPMTLDESVAVLLYEFAELGIGPDEWGTWPWDVVELFWDERLKRDRRRGEELAEHRRACSAAKVPTRVFFSIPLR
jgi:hypothetical protein